MVEIEKDIERLDGKCRYLETVSLMHALQSHLYSILRVVNVLTHCVC